MILVGGNCVGNCKSPEGEPIWCVFLCQQYIVYSIYSVRYLMVLVYVISVTMIEVEVILYSNMLSSEHNLAYSSVCFTDHTADT